MNRRAFAVFLLFLVPLLTAPARAQEVQGVISGLVRDSSGAAIPGATVRIVNEATRSAVDAVTDERGAFRVGVPTPGRYRIEAGLDGFETVVRQVALDAVQTSELELTLSPARFTEGVVVTARRVEEVAQEVPIPVSVIGGQLVEDSGAFNVNRLKELVPTVQFYSSNPRNSAINIRGLGAPFGLTNDGIEPGVGLYIDGVLLRAAGGSDARLPRYRTDRSAARPAGDAVRQEHDRWGDQRDHTQADLLPRDGLRAQLRQPRARAGEGIGVGPLFGKVAGRVSFSGTTREGTIQNTYSALDLNGLNNLGVRGQLLYAAVGQAGDHAGRRTTRGSARTATRRLWPECANPCGLPTVSTRRSPPISVTRRPASTPSIG